MDKQQLHVLRVCFCININDTAAAAYSLLCLEWSKWRRRRRQRWHHIRVASISERLLRVNPSISKETNEGHSRESHRFTHQTYLYENKCQMRRPKPKTRNENSWPHSHTHTPSTRDWIFRSHIMHVLLPSSERASERREIEKYRNVCKCDTHQQQTEMTEMERARARGAHTRDTKQPFKSYS